MPCVSLCPRCNEAFEHESSASTHGYYAISCKQQHKLLRCTSCTYVVDHLRADNMRRHQLRHTVNNTDDDYAYADVSFDNNTLADNNEDTANSTLRLSNDLVAQISNMP